MHVTMSGLVGHRPGPSFRKGHGASVLVVNLLFDQLLGISSPIRTGAWKSGKGIISTSPHIHRAHGKRPKPYVRCGTRDAKSAIVCAVPGLSIFSRPTVIIENGPIRDGNIWEQITVSLTSLRTNATGSVGSGTGLGKKKDWERKC